MLGKVEGDHKNLKGIGSNLQAQLNSLYRIVSTPPVRDAFIDLSNNDSGLGVIVDYITCTIFVHVYVVLDFHQCKIHAPYTHKKKPIY